MKRAPDRWLIVLTACCLIAFAGVAHAQISVAVTSTVAVTISPGASISNAGSFTVTNTSGSSVTISAVTISATNASIFSSMSLTGQVPGSAAVVVQSSPSPPASSNTFNFPSLPVLLNGQTATFTLSAVASTAPSATPTPASVVDLRRGSPVYAGMMSPLASGSSKMPGMMLTVVALGMLLMTGRLRRRHLVVLALAAILAATELGCGNTTGVTGSSTQIVQTITVSSGGTPTGLPATLGSITVQ